jgi:hypothetical protein
MALRYVVVASLRPDMVRGLVIQSDMQRIAAAMSGEPDGY